jgi:hypothetical protein
LSARQKVRRLPKIGTARLDAIIWPDWDVERLLEVAIEVADQEVLSAFRTGKPSFEGARDAGAELARRANRELRGFYVHREVREIREKNKQGEQGDQGDRKFRHRESFPPRSP